MRLGGTNFRGQLPFFGRISRELYASLYSALKWGSVWHHHFGRGRGGGSVVDDENMTKGGGWFWVWWRYHGMHLLMEIIGKKSGLFRIQRIMWRHHGGRSWTMMTVDRSLTILMWKHPNYIPSITCGWTRWKLRTECILAASKAPSQELVPDLCLSVCPFICLSVTAFLLW